MKESSKAVVESQICILQKQRIHILVKSALCVHVSYLLAQCSVPTVLCCAGKNSQCKRGGCFCDEYCVTKTDCCDDYNQTCIQCKTKYS